MYFRTNLLQINIAHHNSEEKRKAHNAHIMIFRSKIDPFKFEHQQVVGPNRILLNVCSSNSFMLKQPWTKHVYRSNSIQVIGTEIDS